LSFVENMDAVLSLRVPTLKVLTFAIAMVVIMAFPMAFAGFWWKRGMRVPEAYYQFIMEYAPYVYVTPEIGPDPFWGRAAFAAAFAIDFLDEAYHDSQFTSTQKATIYSKIVSLADFILTQQFVADSTKSYYGGFQSNETTRHFYSADAARIIPSLLRAHRLTGTSSYLDAARLAGSRFLYEMQNPPTPAIVDRYYGGFIRGIVVVGELGESELRLTQMDIENLYALIGLKMLIDYDPANKARYENMMQDAIGFLCPGFENLYLWYDPPPRGEGKWQRVGLSKSEIYDDPFAYALLGIYDYEGWSTTAQKVYNFINTIGASGEYRSYDPAVSWAGYIDVVDRLPACDYYDAVTAGILGKIRRNHDRSSFDVSTKIIDQHREQFMFWGVRFVDYSYVEHKKAMATVSWLSLLFLNL